MSTSDEREIFNSVDNEQINEFDDYDEHIISDSTSSEEKSTSVKSIHPKWRKTPRTVSDFFESKTSISSCKDSDYEAWLENYYQELYQNQSALCFSHQETDTKDLAKCKSEKGFELFTPVEKDVWSYSTKYWKPKDVRRHWALRIKKGKFLYLPSIYPHLNLRSRYGRFHFLLNSAAAVPENSHKQFACRTFKKVVQDVKELEPQLKKFMLCDDLCNFRWFDDMTKRTVTKILCEFLKQQNFTEKVYLENANLDKLDGIILLCALSRNAGRNVSELHLWKMFRYGQCPLLSNDLARKGKVTSADKNDFFIKIHYLQILSKFSNLTHLSVNYAYLANRNGDALLSLKCVRLGCLRELRLLCLKDERPLVTNPGYGVGGWKISDGVWKRVAGWCPQLRVSFVFLNVPQYENVILFLSESIPVSYVYISSGMDFNFQVPWDVDSTLLELRNWYSSTLETLSLHLWHHRDLLDFVIRCKILEEFPNLRNFEFIGRLEDVGTLEEFCCKLAKGIYKLKTLLFWVEEEHTDKKKLTQTREEVARISKKYRKKFLVVDIDADLQTYAL